ncbi:MAG: BamA/TamA family outer membrane protein [Fimbriimonadaceae bacterium]|nr:BamA/TamA family outer membrane protein [Fimbriimonadaceae bacterium]
MRGIALKGARRGLLLVLLLCATTWAMAQNRTIRAITVEGNNRVTSEAILTSMRWKVGSTYNEAERASEEDLVLSMGLFREVEIRGAVVNDTDVDVVVAVVENPVIKEVKVVGNTVVSTEEITALAVADSQDDQVGQPLGEIYRNTLGRSLAEAIRDLYSTRGYSIQIEQLGPDPESEGTLVIRVLETRLNEIRIVNEDSSRMRTRQSTFERILRTRQTGVALNERNLRRDIEDLYATGWFDSIQPTATPGRQPGTLDVTLFVKERPTGLFNIGAALDPQSRLVGLLTYQDTNFRGSGQSVGANLSQATVGGGPSVDLTWTDRYFDDRGTSVSANVYSRVQYNFTGTGANPFASSSDRNFDERRTGLDLSIIRPIGQDLFGQVGLTAENIRSIDLQSANNQNQNQFVQQNGDVAILKLGVSRDQRTPRLEPYRGSLATITIEPGYSNISRVGGQVAGQERVLGVNTFVRSTLEYRQYWPLDRWSQERLDDPVDTLRPIIAMRARYGHIGGTVPFFEQLFVGGSGSLRGYDNQQFWGSQSLLATVEYRRPIQRNFNVIAFADYGGAWGGYGTVAGFPQSNTPRLRLAYGLGAGFVTPLGPIRLDYAFNQEGSSRLHFSIGSSF